MREHQSTTARHRAPKLLGVRAWTWEEINHVVRLRYGTYAMSESQGIVRAVVSRDFIPRVASCGHHAPPLVLSRLVLSVVFVVSHNIQLHSWHLAPVITEPWAQKSAGRRPIIFSTQSHVQAVYPPDRFLRRWIFRFYLGNFILEIYNLKIKFTPAVTFLRMWGPYFILSAGNRRPAFAHAPLHVLGPCCANKAQNAACRGYVYSPTPWLLFVDFVCQ